MVALTPVRLKKSHYRLLFFDTFLITFTAISFFFIFILMDSKINFQYHKLFFTTHNKPNKSTLSEDKKI